MAQGEEKDLVHLGDYIVIQRQKYSKLHKVHQKATAVLGGDHVELSGIIGKPIRATFRMVPKKNVERRFDLEESDIAESLTEKLKKKKKYFDYVTIRRPTIKCITDILYRQDTIQVLGLRMETLSQLVLAAGMCSEGTYILYESGYEGLVASAMLNIISDGGRMIHIHPGNIPHKQAIPAKHYSESQLQRLISVNMLSLLCKLKVGNMNTYTTDNVASNCTTENTSENQLKIIESSENEDSSDAKSMSEVDGKSRRSVSDDEEKSNESELETEKAADILRVNKVDALIVVGREHPANIVMTLLPFVAPSRPFVVYYVYREPLQDLYIQLKVAKKCVALRLRESWPRSHQVLPGGTEGYLLSGTVVE